MTAASFFCRVSVLMNSVAAKTLAVAQWKMSNERQPTVPVGCSASCTAKNTGPIAACRHEHA
jgi:hypothetical protein